MQLDPIGVFDSGVGGLTVLKTLAHLMPNETYIYIGDNCHSPYGEKTREQLLAYTTAILEKFKQQGVKLVVMACNTTSSLVLEQLQALYPDMTIIGVIDATVAEVMKSQAQHVLVMATSATIQSGVYQKKITLPNHGLACPALVPLIEQASPTASIDEALRSLLEPYVKDYDTIVLGCTHYPIIAPRIHALYPGLKLISSSDAVANAVYTYCEWTRGLSDTKKARSKILTTGPLESFILSSRSFFDYRGYDVRYLSPLK